MKINRYICNLLLLIAIAGSLLSASEVSAMVEGKWSYISSFNPNSTVSSNTNPNHVRRIVDGKRYAYFLVHSRSYKHSIKGGTDYGMTSWAAPVLFRADNLAPTSTDAQAQLEPVASIPGVGGTTVSNVEYNGEVGVLVVAYTNGNISLLYDNGEIVTITDFANMRIPGLKEVRNITFDTDNNRVYMAGMFGFFVLDVEKQMVADLCISQQPLDYVFRCGDSLIASTSTFYSKIEDKNQAAVGLTYVANYEDGLVDWSAFQPLMVDEEKSVFTTSTNAADIEKGKAALLVNGQLTGAMWAAPFNENTFCVMTNPGSTRTMSVLSPGADGKWNLLFVENQNLPYQALDTFEKSLYEGYCTRCEKGWAMPVGSFYRMFDISVSPDFTASNPNKDYTDRAYSNKNIYPSDSDVLYKERRFSSYDATTGWVYEPFKGFKKAERTKEDGTWRDLTALSLPNAPVVSMTNNMAWHPETGLVVRQFGYDEKYGIKVTDYDHMSIRKDGGWIDYSMKKTNPSLIGGFYDPRGAVIDPMHPNHVYGGSQFCGVVRRNLEDESDVMFLGCPGTNSKNESLPGFVSAFPFQQSWKGLNTAESLSFDVDGNMWLTYMDFTANELGIYEWKRSAIDASLNANINPSEYVPLTSWNISLGNIYGVNKVWPLSHQSNKGLLVISQQNDGSRITIAEIREDDSVLDLHTIDGYINDNGQNSNAFGCYGLYEDPQTGKVWFGSSNGLSWFNPREAVEKEQLTLHKAVSIAIKGNSNQLSFCECETPNYIVSDELNRIWCGTTAGIYCLTSDGQELLGHFNKSNSPLETDDILGLCWDGTAHSLIVSTREGLFEFTPYEGMNPDNIDSVRVWPAVVEPGFNGWVSISGVPSSMTLALSKENATEKINLPAANAGMVQWDVMANGKRVAPGKYNVVEKTTDRKLGEIVIY